MNGNKTGTGRARLAGIVVLSVLAGVALATLGRYALHAVGGAGGQGPEMRDVGGVRVGVETRPKSPKVGENDLRVWVEDAGGRPLENARVEAVVFMPAMGAMPSMESRPLMRSVGAGVYQGRFNIVMGGSWDIDLKVTAAGRRPVPIALRLTVGTAGLTWVSGGWEASAGSGADTAAAVPAGTVTIPAQLRQEIGVTTMAVEVRDLDHVRRVAGRVAFDETRRAEVTLKFGGWIRELRADYTGMPVSRGGELFTVYSPDLYSAQREFVEALAVRDTLPPGPSRDRAAELAQAARRRLALWDLTEAQIARLEAARQPQEALPIVSPVNGVIVEKMIVQGSAVMPGMTLLRIAPVDPVWVLADVYPYELGLLRIGDPVAVRLPMSGATARKGRISFLSPFLDGQTRTGEIRAEIPNRDRALRPDQLVDVDISVPLGRKLAVPVAAVLYSGERRVVFVDIGQGRLEPREIRLGPRAGDHFAVESGLREGDRVVTSGNFLIAAESRLRAATTR